MVAGGWEAGADRARLSLVLKDIRPKAKKSLERQGHSSSRDGDAKKILMRMARKRLRKIKRSQDSLEELDARIQLLRKGEEAEQEKQSEHEEQNSRAREEGVHQLPAQIPLPGSSSLAKRQRAFLENVLMDHDRTDLDGGRCPCAHARLEDRADVETLRKAYTMLEASGAVFLSTLRWVLLLHCVSRRDVVSLGLSIIVAGQWFCNKKRAQELFVALSKAFKPSEARWDTKRPNGGFKLLRVSIFKGWNFFAKFTVQLVQTPCPWGPAYIDECLAPQCPGFRKAGTAYRRGSRLRVSMLVSSWRAGRRPGGEQGAWSMWVELLPGTKKGATDVGLVTSDSTTRAVEYINGELARRGLERPRQYDVHDLAMALCLKDAPNQFHKDQGRPFRVLGSWRSAAG